MCGRYYVDDDTAREIEKIVQHVEAGLIREAVRGEVRPSAAAPVIYIKDHLVTAGSMRWGFPRYQKSGLLINARAETVTERPTFRESVLHRRCVIPAKHYYEWNAERDKVSFSREDSPILYMAGIYKMVQGQEKFVVITTQANDSVRPVHDRMPLILDTDELERWVRDDQAVDFILSKTPVRLEHQQEYRQMTLKI